MRFNIIICEYVKLTLIKIASVALEHFENSEFEFDCHQIQSDFSKVLEYAKISDKCRNIYLLDIELAANVNGLNLAQKIREYDYLGYIIFITSHTEHSVTALAYKLKILDFIDKTDRQFKKCLSECFDTVIKESLVVKN